MPLSSLREGHRSIERVGYPGSRGRRCGRIVEHRCNLDTTGPHRDADKTRPTTHASRTATSAETILYLEFKSHRSKHEIDVTTAGLAYGRTTSKVHVLAAQRESRRHLPFDVCDQLRTDKLP